MKRRALTAALRSPSFVALMLGLWTHTACQPRECLEARDIFEQEVWVPVMSQQCASCHEPGGAADQQGSSFRLAPPTFPNFIDVNYENVAQVAQTKIKGQSILLLKPLGKEGHGGGAILQENSNAYKALELMVKTVENPPTCPQNTNKNLSRSASLHDAASVYRKSVYTLSGLPVDANIIQHLQSLEKMPYEQEIALQQAITQLTYQPEFYRVLRELLNDRLLTDKYLPGTSAVDLLHREHYPQIEAWFDNPNQPLSNEDRAATNRAIAREPIELAVYLVRNNLPFTQWLTADYTVVNPWSAQLYGVSANFQNPNDTEEFVPARIQYVVNDTPLPMPHAGILTNPMILNRYPTTSTNLNRHRAKVVMEMFLATDILTLGTRPIDANEEGSYANPTRDNPTCNVCHNILDPIAGAFQKWDNNDQERRDPNRVWPIALVPPGFGTEQMETTDYPSAEAWLAQRLVQDKRFPLAMVHMIYKGLMGVAPLQYPADPSEVDFASKRAAYKLQERLFQSIVENFVANNYNLRILIVDLLTSPLLRGKGLKDLTDLSNGQLLNAEQTQAINFLGSYRFLSPEMLHRKLTSLFEFSWGGTNRPYLLFDYRMLYGGMDSDAVTTRLRYPNGVMMNLAYRMANEAACHIVVRDFFKAKENRILFPYVTPDMRPETDSGAPIPSEIAKIEQNIAHLHELLLNENNPLEVAQTYRLFRQVWLTGKAHVVAEEESDYLPYACRLYEDPQTNAQLANNQRIERDSSYLIRAWMATVSYLLSDYRFLND